MTLYLIYLASGVHTQCILTAKLPVCIIKIKVYHFTQAIYIKSTEYCLHSLTV